MHHFSVQVIHIFSSAIIDIKVKHVQTASICLASQTKEMLPEATYSAQKLKGSCNAHLLLILVSIILLKFLMDHKCDPPLLSTLSNPPNLASRNIQLFPNFVLSS
jgi:hypothetical protein